MEKISLPAAATFLSPKTGEATKTAHSFPSCSAADAHVSGCTVEVSTNIFPFNEQAANSAFDTRSLRTASLDIYKKRKTRSFVSYSYRNADRSPIPW
jgi:hypothetical protein